MVLSRGQLIEGQLIILTVGYSVTGGGCRGEENKVKQRLDNGSPADFVLFEDYSLITCPQFVSGFCLD